MLDRTNLLLRFKSIAEAGSLRRAADVLNITQPALSRSLHQLEEHYGQPLFERHARGIRPTIFGQKLLSTVSRLRRDWELAEQELMTPGSPINGVLKIDAGPLWAAVTLPVIATRFQELFPNIALEIGFLSGDNGINALLNGELDIVFGGLPRLEPGYPEIVAHHFTTVNDRVVARDNHPIHQRAADDYGALLEYPWITFLPNPLFASVALHSVVERTGSMPDVKVKSASLFAVIRLLQEGNYLCILPDAFAAGVSGRPLKQAPIVLSKSTSRSGALYRKNIANYEPLRALMDMCAAYFADVKTDDMRAHE